METQAANLDFVDWRLLLREFKMQMTNGQCPNLFINIKIYFLTSLSFNNDINFFFFFNVLVELPLATYNSLNNSFNFFNRKLHS